MASPSSVLTLGLGSWGSASLLLTLGYNFGGTGGKLCFGVTAHPALLGEATSYAALQGKIAAHATLKGEVRVNPC